RRTLAHCVGRAQSIRAETNAPSSAPPAAAASVAPLPFDQNTAAPPAAPIAAGTPNRAVRWPTSTPLVGTVAASLAPTPILNALQEAGASAPSAPHQLSPIAVITSGFSRYPAIVWCHASFTFTRRSTGIALAEPPGAYRALSNRNSDQASGSRSSRRFTHESTGGYG